MSEATEKEQSRLSEGTGGENQDAHTEGGRAQQVAAELTRLAYAQVPTAFVITLFNATLFVFVLRQVVDFFPLLSWWTAVSSIACFRLGLMYRYRRAAPAPAAAHRWRTRFLRGAIVAGCGWGATSIFLFPTESFAHQTFFAFILGGMALGSVTSMAAIKSAYVGFVLLTTVPLILRFFSAGGELLVAMGVLSVIFVAGILVMAAQFHAAIRESLAFRFERRDLLQSHEVLQQSNEELDRRVRARTTELMTANAALQVEIAEHERSEHELRESEARSRAMLQAIPDIVFRLSRDGEYLDYKAETGTDLFAPPEIFLGKRLVDILPPSVAQQTLPVIAEALRTGKTQVLEYALPLRGEPREFEARIAISGPEEVVAIVRDITQRKEVERLKDELISMVSHELRTPLASVRGFTELMLTRNFPPEKQRELLFIIQRETTRLTGLINDFLDLQRMEARQQNYQMADVDLAAILRTSVALFSNTVSLHTFQLEIPEQGPWIRADADRLHQLMINLLSNAVKFSPHGGEIGVGIRVHDDHVLVWVRDYGVGIAPEAVPKVFERFFRADNRDTRNIGGTGLGLALVKEIVIAHKGKAWVESTLGQGSTFFFTLPLAG